MNPKHPEEAQIVKEAIEAAARANAQRYFQPKVGGGEFYRERVICFKDGVRWARENPSTRHTTDSASAHIERLEDNIKHKQAVIDAAWLELDLLGVPTNGPEGLGERQDISLAQRIKRLGKMNEIRRHSVETAKGKTWEQALEERVILYMDESHAVAPGCLGKEGEPFYFSTDISRAYEAGALAERQAMKAKLREVRLGVEALITTQKQEGLGLMGETIVGPHTLAILDELLGAE